ncbi:FhaA domain-containing protein [Serinicoccus chungangensis]|uniref:FhaA domain-containing protein n=1 Tax=Serinicoccus chungangensis TaxID=767452 RepID=UPI0011190F4D
MGVFDRLERGLERAVKQPFAKVFKAEVQPVEIASAMRGAMDDRAAVLGPGRTMVPNVFTVELAESDYERLASYEHALTDELVAAAEDHADAQRYVAPGPFEVRLVSGEELETGIFRVRPTAKDGRQGGQRGGAREFAQAQRARDERREAQEREQREADARRAAQASDHDRDAEAYEESAYRRPAQERPRPRRSGPALTIDGRQVPLTTAVTTLGRGDDCTIVVDDPGASRRHAEIRIGHDGPHLQVILRDLNSTNGTYLNGEQVGSEELRSGDRITLGRTHITVHLEG